MTRSSSPQTLSFKLPAISPPTPRGENLDFEGVKRRRVLVDATGDAVESKWVNVRLVELIGDVGADDSSTSQQHYGLFVWPSAQVLAHYVASERHSFSGKVIMELGCGTGLPGILAALCSKPAKVYLTDRSDAADTKRNAETNIELNGLEGVVEFLPLNWGDMLLPESTLQVLETVDVVLAADCFYQSEDFEKVVATVALIFRCSPSARFVTTYQLRSISRSIAPLLARWGMTARAIDSSSFLPPDAAFESVYTYEISPSHT